MPGEPQFPGFVAMTAGGPHAWIMINALREEFGPFPVILENSEPDDVFWDRRKRLLGKAKVASIRAAQVLMKLTKPLSRGRIPQLIAEHDLKAHPDEDQSIIRVASINTDRCRDALRSIGPGAVFVVSTRMISADTLNCIDAPFINYHSGINPAYRGFFGGYFALANGEPEHFGTTVHLVDEGVDTGEVLYQNQIDVSRRDNFHTYLWLMAAHSRDLVVQAIRDALAGALAPYKRNLPSKQYFAPTLGFYLKAGFGRGVW